MANLTNQADLDALRSATQATYIDTDTAGTNVQNTVVVRPGYMMITAAVASDITGSPDFIADDAIVNVTAVQSGSGGQFTNGSYSAARGATSYTHTSGNKQSPGWTAIAGQPRPTFNLQDHTVRSPNGGQVTNHFGCMATSGSNFDGYTMEAGAIYLPIGAVVLNNVSFSPTAADDSGTGTVRQTYARMQFFTGGDVPQVTSSFFGMYGGDVTNWTVTADRDTANNCISMNIRKADHWTPSGTTIVPGNTDADGTMLGFLINMNYSQTILDNGFSFESGNNGNTNMSLRLITGESWAPEWLDDLNGNPVTDIVVDFGNRTVWTATDVADVTGNIPIEASSDGTNNYLANYSGSTKRTGYLLETNRGLSSAGLFQQVLPVTQPLSITGIPYYSYTHECYDNSGDVTTRASTAAVTTSNGEFVYDQTVLDTTSVAAEGSLLNSRTLAQATALTTGNTLSSLDDLYPANKSVSYTTRATTQNYSVTGSVFSVGDLRIRFFGGATISNTIQALINSATAVSGGTLVNTLKGKEMDALSTVTLSSMTLDFENVNLSNVTLGSGITLDGGDYTNISTVVSEKTFTNNPVLNLVSGQTYTFNDDIGDFTLNLASGACTVNITGTTATPTTTGAGTITIPVDSTNTTFVVESDKASGAYVLRNTTDGVEIANGLHTAGVTTTVATITNVASGSKTYSLLYKPNNVTTGTIAQQRFGQTYNVTANNDATVNTTVGAVEQYHAETLTALAEAADSSAVTMLFVLTGDTAKAEITVAGTDINRALVVVTQRATLISLDNVVGGKSQYLTFLSVNDMNRDIVVPAQGNIIEFDNENDQLLYTSALALTIQKITGVIALSSTDNTTASITSTDGSLAVPGVIIYDSPIVTDAQLAGAIKPLTDSVENRVADIGDYAESEKIPGIDPKPVYDGNTDYTG